jgi:hypothetical protein
VTTTNGTIAAASTAQWTGVDPTTATTRLTLSNTSGDVLVFAGNGSPASMTNGVVVAAGQTIVFDKTAINGLPAPTGPLSVWGPKAGLSYSVTVT